MSQGEGESVVVGGRQAGDVNHTLKTKERTKAGNIRRQADRIAAARAIAEGTITVKSKPSGPITGRPKVELSLPDHVNEPAPVATNAATRNFQPSPSQRVLVAGLHAFGVAHEGIAAYIKVNEQTIKTYFQYELAEARPRTEAALVAMMLVKALGGNIPAITFLLKSGFGWSETAKSNGPTSIEALTPEQRIQLMEGIRSSLAATTPRATRGRTQPADLDATAGTTDEGDQLEG